MAATFFIKLLSVIVIPFLTRTLSVEDFAIYDLFIVINSFLVMVLTLGMASGLAIKITELIADESKLAFLFMLSLFSCLFMTLLAWGICISVVFVFDIGGLPLFAWHGLFIYTFFSLISYTVFNFLRWTGKATIAALVNVLSAFLGLSIGISLMVLMRNEVTLYIIGLVIGAILGGIACLYIVRQYIVGFKIIDNWKEEIKDLLKLSLPFVPNYIGNRLLTLSDRLIILMFLDLKAAGIYALLSRIASIPNLFTGVLTSGFQPVLLKNYKVCEGRKLIRHFYNSYMVFICLAVITTYLIDDWVITFFGGEKYTASSYLVPVMVSSSLLMESGRFCGFGYVIARKTAQIMYITNFVLGLNILLSVLLAQILGLDGIIIGTLIAAMTRSFLHPFYAEKAYTFNYNFKMLSVSLISVFVISFISLLSA
jgi:O-antigen/teichoic acid export membrane protein